MYKTITHYLGCLGSRTLFISSVVQYNVILKLHFALSIYITMFCLLDVDFLAYTVRITSLGECDSGQSTEFHQSN